MGGYPFFLAWRQNLVEDTQMSFLKEWKDCLGDGQTFGVDQGSFRTPRFQDTGSTVDHTIKKMGITTHVTRHYKQSPMCCYLRYPM